MKTSVLSLVVAATAFGGTSIYLWNQLQDERARADEFAAKSAELNARIAELEKARGQLGERRLVGANSFGGGPAMVGPGPGLAPPTDASADAKSGTGEELHRFQPPSPERIAAIQKMMRGQMRAGNKRMYADVGSALGLTKEQANKLVDLITEQQMSQFGQQREMKDANEARSALEEVQRQNKAELTDLLGADKVASLEEYQKSLPARQELDMLSRQLEGFDAPLNEDQRQRMLKVMTEERERVPAPEYVEGTDMMEFQKTRMAWEDDYNERVSSQTRGILNSTQASAYNDYQEGQKEMRDSFATVTGPGGSRVMMRGVAGGNVRFNGPPPQGGVMFAETVDAVAAPAVPKKK